MPSSYTSLLYHVVFATHDRRPWLTEAVRAELHPYAVSVVRAKGGTLLEIGGVADHVHLLMGLHQDVPVSAAVRDLKANTSRWLRQRFPELRDFGWQTGYGAFTVSLRGVASVRGYIDHQAEHHRAVGFAEEFADFCRQHGLEPGAFGP